jgi:DNA-binding NtrC family response regulator
MVDVNNPQINVILVEDDLAQAKWVSRLLVGRLPEGVELLTFTDSSVASAHLGEEWVDVIITDLDMPEVDGLALVRRAREFNPRVQVVIVTAASTSAALVDAGDIGVADYLLKPVDIQTVAGLIEQAAERVGRWRRALSGTLALKRGH